MTKFPLVRDLWVDRSRLFEDLKRAKAWVPIDGTYDLGAGPPVSQEEQEQQYPLSRCISCGCCLEACPQVNDRSSFIGPAAISGPTPGMASAPMPTSQPSVPPSSPPAPAPAVAPSGAFVFFS